MKESPPSVKLEPIPLVEPYRSAGDCDHGIKFDEKECVGLSAAEVRQQWPRLDGECPMGCGYNGIAYLNFLHYLAGDY
jgi:hypothetical protein